jgi:competence protein ComEA
MQTKKLSLGLSLWLLVLTLLATALLPGPLLAGGQPKETKMVDVNSASLTTLQTLPGITHTLATRIVNGRPYKNIGDLKKIDGMTSSKIKAIKGDITFGSTAKTSKTKSAKSTKTTTEPEVASDQPATPAKARPSTTTHSSAQSTHKTQTSPSETPTPTGASSGRLPAGQTVNINTASLEELDALPGIGPTKAQAIIDYRNEHGRFNSIEDIQNVKGIKEGEFSKIKDSITVR